MKNPSPQIRILVGTLIRSKFLVYTKNYSNFSIFLCIKIKTNFNESNGHLSHFRAILEVEYHDFHHNPTIVNISLLV